MAGGFVGISLVAGNMVFPLALRLRINGAMRVSLRRTMQYNLTDRRQLSNLLLFDCLLRYFSTLTLIALTFLYPGDCQ